MKESKKGITASQLSILTGLHRKDVTAFLQNCEESQFPLKQSMNSGAAIVARWISDPHYTDADGNPRALPYQSTDKDDFSFTTLVTSISKDIRPRPYADDLIRLGIVSAESDGTLHLQKAAFMPTNDFSEKLQFFEKNISDHLSAASENMVRSPSPHFDRSAFHAHLSQEDLAFLRTILETDGMDLLKSLYKKSSELSEKNTEAETKNRRVTIGLYMYQEENHDENK